MRLAALAAASVLAACDGLPWPWAPKPTPIPLVPAIRLVGTRFKTGGGPGVASRAYVTIDEVIRPTFSGSQPLVFKPACTPIPDRPDVVDCPLRVPDRFPATRWGTVEVNLRHETATKDDGGAPTSKASPRKLRALVPRDRKAASGARTARLPKEATKLFVTRLVPDLATRSVATPELTLPGGGALRTWIGVEEPAWSEEATPVVFTVSRVAGGTGEAEPLFRRELDPGRRPGDRGWIEVEIPLEDRGDEAFRLLFETLPPRAGDVRPSLPVWGDPTILRPEAGRRRPRHVVLISLDTLRARSMSAYGYELPTTPNFDRMMAEGTLFENAFTTYSNTLGSHMSMITGLYPANHGVLGMQEALAPVIPTLAERMRDAGYETAAFTEDALLRAAAGFQRGFARYFENTEIADGTGDAAGTFGRALEWAEKQPDQPLFLFVHTYEVHSPYLPPADTADALPSPASGSDGKLHAYEREIVNLDRLLADFVRRLERLGAPGDLLLVITADHGEEFHEHGSNTHVQLYDEVMHIPLFLRWPGRVPADARIETPVSLVDVVPTILGLVGLPSPPGDGVSLVPLLDGAEIARDVVYGQSTESALLQRQRRYVARNARGKCMVRHEDEEWVECYDLEADPREEHPLAPETDPELASLHQKALAYRAQALREQDPGAPSTDVKSADAVLDPAREEKLRRLGYIE